MIRTQIQVHQNQMKWLKKLAVEKGIPMSQVIRDSIEFYRLYVEKSRELHSKKKKALKAVGVSLPILPNISFNILSDLSR